MQLLLELLEKIPNVVWSGIIASVITLLGVFASNRDNTKRLLLQLEHDGKQKAIERKAAMRRDVYLKAAEEMTNANVHLGSLLQADLVKTNAATGVQGLLIAIAKVSVVGEMQTVRETSELGTMYGVLTIKLLKRLSPIQSLKTDIEIANSQHARCIAESERLMAQAKAIHESGQPDENRTQLLLAANDVVVGRLDRISAELEVLYARQTPLNNDFTRFMLQQLAEVSEQSLRVSVAIRGELDIESNIEQFAEMLRANQQRLIKQIEDLLESLSDD